MWALKHGVHGKTFDCLNLKDAPNYFTIKRLPKCFHIDYFWEYRNFEYTNLENDFEKNNIGPHNGLLEEEQTAVEAPGGTSPPGWMFSGGNGSGRARRNITSRVDVLWG